MGKPIRVVEVFGRCHPVQGAIAKGRNNLLEYHG
jgi:hypothetical protein